MSIEEFQQRLQSRASESTKDWWERYLRGTASFRGVRMADIRSELRGWYSDRNLAARTPREQAEIGLALIRTNETEDKLGGILLFQEILIPSGQPSWAELLPGFEELFEESHLADWNAVDWFCVKVLGPLIERDGEPSGRAISDWRGAITLWQRRASAVAFVNLVKEAERFPSMYDLVLQSCTVLVSSSERFSQTGAGWVLRELSHSSPEIVLAFLSENAHRMSREALRNALKTFPEDVRARMLSRRNRELGA
jgi:3-methyladenine DNA glycosylase AlkD